MYQTISVQQLRTELPNICGQLEQGVSYVLIRRSRPIAEIRPLSSHRTTAQQQALRFFAAPPKAAQFKATRSAQQLIRKERA